MVKIGNSTILKYRRELENAKTYAEVWQIVKNTTETSIGKHRVGMMLFLDDLPLQLGAYHPVGTNNIVLNRNLVEIVEASEEPRGVVNALIYNLLLHEYLHALGDLTEESVKQTVISIAQACFGDEHETTVIDRKSPWSLLRNIPVAARNVPKRVMRIVTDFEKRSEYIV
jgi:hypothetical protein